MKASAWLSVSAVSLAALALGPLAGCTGEGPGDTPGTSPPARTSAVPACSCEPRDEAVVDPVLLAFLSRARAAHHVADLAEGSGDRAGAVAALDKLVSGPKPPGSAPELREVLADSRARLADLRSAGGDFDAAQRDVDAGLALAGEPTHFRGHLFEVRGLVEERRAAAFAKAHDAEGEKRAKQAALDAFQQAIDIQFEVIQRALGPGGGGAAPTGPKP